MFRPSDLLMLAVIFGSIALGIFVPSFGRLFDGAPLWCMMAVLYISFLSIRLVDVWEILGRDFVQVMYFAAIKLVALPVAIFALFSVVLPEYALAALLLSGISTGVVSVFFAGLVQANAPLVLVMIVVTSLLVPFTLPTLVILLAGKMISIPFVAMARLLGLVIFVPILVAELTHRFAPTLGARIRHRQQPISLVLFAATNLGVFARYSDFLRERPETLLTAVLVGVALAAGYFVLGLVCAWSLAVAEKLAFIIGFAIMNNILVVVFATQFFSPLEPTVAAMYTIPFFSMILPLRLYRHRHPVGNREDTQ